MARETGFSGKRVDYKISRFFFLHIIAFIFTDAREKWFFTKMGRVLTPEYSFLMQMEMVYRLYACL